MKVRLSNVFIKHLVATMFAVAIILQLSYDVQHFLLC